MFYKSLNFLALCVSLGIGGCFLFLVFKSIPEDLIAPSLPQESYTVLIADESCTDAAILETLPPALADTVIAESNQWVLLDDFGELERIPLPEYDKRLESFDPRRDGYAEKLRSFFVQNGKRFLFIPREPKTQILTDTLIERGGEAVIAQTIPQLSTAQRTPHALKAQLLYLALGTAAFVISLACAKNRFFLLCAYPVFAALSMTGQAGLLLCAVLYTLFSMVLPGVQAYFVSRRYKRRLRIGAVNKQLVLLCGGGLILYGLICIMSTLWLGIAGFACLCVMVCMVLWAQSNRGRIHNHVRFTPLPITGSALVQPAQLRLVMPLSAVVLLALFIPLVVSEPAALIEEFDFISPASLIDPIEYEAHAFFQSTFSLFPLGTSITERKEQQYKRYALGSDGLIAASEDTALSYAIPPFPLEALMGFLKNYQTMDVFSVPSRYTLNVVWIVFSLLFLLLCGIPIKSRITRVLSSLAGDPHTSIFLNNTPSAAALLETARETENTKLCENRSANIDSPPPVVFF
ncbi:MAG: hypothetical protein LBO67_07850 [Spirochaetaceae bacterium]|jgi:hypothetical protein|nr:hypothetical protein [Spirochaetaceae bacterium]